MLVEMDEGVLDGCLHGGQSLAPMKSEPGTSEVIHSNSCRCGQNVVESQVKYPKHSMYGILTDPRKCS